MRIVNPRELGNILEPSDHDWIPISEIVNGDYVRWWNQDALVTGVRKENDNYCVTVVDPMDGKPREFEYKLIDKLHVRTRPNS